MATQVFGYGNKAGTAFTPTGSWTTNTTYTGYVAQVGDLIRVQGAVTLSGAPDAVALTLNSPSGFTIDETKLVTSDSALTTQPVGTVLVGVVGNWPGLIFYNLTNNNFDCLIETTGPNTFTAISSTVPVTFANLDFVFFEYWIPVTS